MSMLGSSSLHNNINKYYIITIFVYVQLFLLYGCSSNIPKTKCTLLKPYWNQNLELDIKDEKDCCRYQCVPARSYQ